MRGQPDCLLPRLQRECPLSSPDMWLLEITYIPEFMASIVQLQSCKGRWGHLTPRSFWSSFDSLFTFNDPCNYVLRESQGDSPYFLINSLNSPWQTTHSQVPKIRTRMSPGEHCSAYHFKSQSVSSLTLQCSLSPNRGKLFCPLFFKCP